MEGLPRLFFFVILLLLFGFGFAPMERGLSIDTKSDECVGSVREDLRCFFLVIVLLVTAFDFLAVGVGEDGNLKWSLKLDTSPWLALLNFFFVEAVVSAPEI